MQVKEGRFDTAEVPKIGYAHFLDCGSAIVAMPDIVDGIFVSSDDISKGELGVAPIGVYVTNLQYEELKRLPEIAGVHFLPFQWPRKTVRLIFEEWDIEYFRTASSDKEKRNIGEIALKVSAFMSRILRATVELIEEINGASPSPIEIKQTLRSCTTLTKFTEVFLRPRFSEALDYEERRHIVQHAGGVGLSVTDKKDKMEAIRFSGHYDRIEYAKKLLQTPLPNRNTTWRRGIFEHPVPFEDFFNFVSEGTDDGKPCILVQVSMSSDAIKNRTDVSNFVKKLMSENSIDDTTMWLSWDGLSEVHQVLPLVIHSFVTPAEEFDNFQISHRLLQVLNSEAYLVERACWSFGIAIEALVATLIQNKVPQKGSNVYEKTVEAAFLSIVDKTFMLPVLFQLFCSGASQVKAYVGSVNIVVSNEDHIIKNVSNCCIENGIILPFFFQRAFPDSIEVTEEFHEEGEQKNNEIYAPFTLKNRPVIYEIDGTMDHHHNKRMSSLKNAGNAIKIFKNSPVDPFENTDIKPVGSEDDNIEAEGLDAIDMIHGEN